MESVLTRLHRWAHRQGENFTTEALVWLLQYLLEKEPEVAQRVICLLCWEDGQSRLPLGHLSVRTQEITEQGRPDICIEADGFRSFIEVKTQSGLGYNQMGRYREALERPPRPPCTRLVLLSRDPVEFAATDPTPDRHLRWYEVAELLQACLREESLSEHISGFVVEQFTLFLKEQGMTIEQVGWEYSNGIAAMRNLLKMLEQAAQSAGFSCSKSSASEWQGFDLDKKAYWLGIWFDRPNEVVLQFLGPSVEQETFKALRESDLPAGYVRDFNNGTPLIKLRLDDEDVHFFALSKENQLNTLTTFLERARQDAAYCRATEVERAADDQRVDVPAGPSNEA